MSRRRRGIRERLTQTLFEMFNVSRFVHPDAVGLWTHDELDLTFHDLIECPVNILTERGYGIDNNLVLGHTGPEGAKLINSVWDAVWQG